MNDIIKNYCDGNYYEVLKELYNKKDIDDLIIKLIIDSYVKSNNTADAVSYSYKVQAIINQLLLQDKFDIAKIFSGILLNNNVLQTALAITAELPIVSRLNLDADKNDYIIQKVKLLDKNKTYVVIPLLWPIAYGDMIIINQFILKIKKDNPNIGIIVICPLNRPEILQLFNINKAIDIVFDVQRMPEEKDRLNTLNLRDSSGFLNLTLQEHLVIKILNFINSHGIKFTIHKWRYFPILNGMNTFYGARIWEEKARLWLQGIELPKLCDTEHVKDKENIIALHFREGNYSDDNRNIHPNFAQDLINRLKETYPNYRLIRLGDSSMTPLFNCEDMTSKDLTIVNQIKIIQDAKLFIGCHSAPQHLAVACSNTPIICINYMTQETCTELGENIPSWSYAPTGVNVKKLFYIKKFDDKGNLLPPNQNIPCAKVEYQTIDEILVEVRNILNG